MARKPDGPAFVAYSAASGQRLGVLFQYTGKCVWGLNTVLWVDDSARHVIGESLKTVQGNPPVFSLRFGEAVAGQFAEFQVPTLGEWVQRASLLTRGLGQLPAPGNCAEAARFPPFLPENGRVTFDLSLGGLGSRR